MQRVRCTHVPYDVWKKQGFLETTEGDVIHYGFIESFIDGLGKKLHIKEINGEWCRWPRTWRGLGLRWMMDNIFVRTDPAENIKPDKEKSTEKIGGAVAAIMAFDRAVWKGGSTGSVYDERGIMYV